MKAGDRLHWAASCHVSQASLGAELHARLTEEGVLQTGVCRLAKPLQGRDNCPRFGVTAGDWSAARTGKGQEGRLEKACWQSWQSFHLAGG